jgi:hypothetical protein
MVPAACVHCSVCMVLHTANSNAIMLLLLSLLLARHTRPPTGCIPVIHYHRIQCSDKGVILFKGSLALLIVLSRNVHHVKAAASSCIASESYAYWYEASNENPYRSVSTPPLYIRHDVVSSRHSRHMCTHKACSRYWWMYGELEVVCFDCADTAANRRREAYEVASMRFDQTLQSIANSIALFCSLILQQVHGHQMNK